MALLQYPILNSTVDDKVENITYKVGQSYQGVVSLTFRELSKIFS